MSLVCDPTLLTEAIGSLKDMLERRGVTISVSGVDGSGKTMITTLLAKTLQDADIAVLRLHSYQWYLNVTMTPVRILINRYVGRKVILLDRSVYDNIAVFLSMHRIWQSVADIIIGFVSNVYPTFDYRFYLSTSLGEGLRRRPEMSESQLSHFQQIYAPIVRRAKYLELESDDRLLDGVLEQLAQR